MAFAYAPKRNRDERRADRGGGKRLGTGASEKSSGIRANPCASIRDFVSLIANPSALPSYTPEIRRVYLRDGVFAFWMKKARS